MSEKTFTMIPIDLIVYCNRNPRTEIKDLEEFAENIKEYGILEPIIVRPREEKFEVVVGERRARASMLAGKKEIPAIIRAITDRQADELRLIENIHRKDLTDAEKGDAVLSLWANYDKYKTIKDVADAINIPYKTVLDNWCRKARKLSDKVKEYLIYNALDRLTTIYLLKFPHTVQDKLAEVIVKNGFGQHKSIQFLKLYDANPKADLDGLVNKAKGIETITLSKSELPSDFLEKIEKKRQLAKIQRIYRKPDKPITKEDVRERQKKLKSEISLLPEEKERLEKATERETRKILQEREKRGEFMQARAELREEKIELPSTPTIDASTMLSRRYVADEKRLNLFEAKDWMIFTKSWFIHNPPPRDEKEELHPAKFPEPLIKNFMEFFTQPTEIVLDPFLGTGSTLVACDISNRQGIGVEIEERYADVARRRTKQPVIVGDARNLDELDILRDLKGKIDFAITSPPYWNMLKKSRGHVRSVSKIREELGADVFYSGKMENLENVEDYEEYLNALHLIFSKAHKLLRPNRYLVIIIQNILTEDGEMKPVAWDLAKKLSHLFLLKQERIWCQDNKPLGCWGYPYRYVSNVHHHYCLVFEKVEA